MLKIQDLKTGDKVFCIKNFTYTKSKKVDDNILNNLSSPQERAKYISECVNNKEKYLEFIKGKNYTISFKLNIYEMYIKGEDSTTLVKAINPSKYSKDEKFLNKHFISQQELRKRKLKELSDNNFFNF